MLHAKDKTATLDADTTTLLAHNVWNVRELLRMAYKLGPSKEGWKLAHHAAELLESAVLPLEQFHASQLMAR